MEKEKCGFNDSVGVRVSTSSGFYPEENLFYEANLDTPISEVLKIAASALNLASTDGFVAKVCHKEIDVNKTFRENGMKCLIAIHYTKLEKGGGSSPLLSQEIFDREVSKITNKFLEIRNWKLVEAKYPNLTVEMTDWNRPSLIVTANCEAYPSSPASYVFKDINKKPLTLIPGLTPGGYINQSAHPVTNVAFICAPGAREYHTHSGHANDLWDNYRPRLNEYGLIPMLDKIHNFWVSGGGQ